MTSNKVPPDVVLEKIAALLSEKAGSWNSETANRIAEIVTSAGYVLPEVAPTTAHELKCPHCGETDKEQIEIMETFRAAHLVVGFTEGGVLQVRNALTTAAPHEHFDDGDGDFIAICNKCSHHDEPEAFGMGDSHYWEWV